MNLSSKQATTGLTVLIVVAILFVVNYLVGGLGFGNFRVDLTQDKLYTLSAGTKSIIDRLNPDKPVTIRYYVTTDERVMPPVLKTHARTVQDLLLEFEKLSDGRIVLEKLNPNPDTEEEDKAREDDIQGMTVNNEGDSIYLGMAIQCLQQKEVLPFLNPGEETALEYNIARAIAKVTKTGKTVVGVMSAMPIQGTPQMPFMQQRNQSQEPWVIIQRLRMDYEVREVPFSTDKIDSDVNVLVVVHPATITEQAEYAIDQYVMKGGKVIAFVDPQCWVAQVYSNQQPNPMMGGQPSFINPSSELKNLFKSWGIGYASDQIVADVSYLAMMQGRRNPTALGLPAAAINQNDRVTASLQSVMMIGAGDLKLEKSDGINAVPLLESSENSEMIDTTAAEKLRTQALTSFNPSGRKKTLGLRLSGKFKTAFPNGKPAAPGGDKPPGETGGAQDDATAPKPAAPATPPAASPTPPPAAATTPPVTVTTPPVSVPPAPAAPAADKPAATATTPPIAVPTTPALGAPAPATPASATPAAPGAAAPAAPAAPAPEAKKDDGTIKESTGDPQVLLFSDADMMFDAFCVQQMPGGGFAAINSNLPMFLNAVELLSGGGDLLAVRSRASTQRPFTKLDEMRDKVEAQFRPELQALQQKLDETAQKISTLRVKRDEKSQTFILDPNQAKGLQELMDTQADINRKIREIRKKQNKEIDRTENMLTLANVLLMPLIVIVVGLLLALRRRAATAAR